MDYRDYRDQFASKYSTSCCSFYFLSFFYSKMVFMLVTGPPLEILDIVPRSCTTGTESNLTLFEDLEIECGSFIVMIFGEVCVKFF